MAVGVAASVETETAGDLARVYEIGYLVSPAVKEEDLEKTVSAIRSAIEQSGGSFIAEGAPAMTKLAYPMRAREGQARVEHDRGYFGWIKFEAGVAASKAISEALSSDPSVMRRILFETVREDTRAKYKPAQLREVKRTDTIRAAPRRREESAAPVSEAELEKAIRDITAE